MSLPELRRLVRHHHDASFAVSSLLWMAQSARSDAQRRRYRAMRAREQGRAAGLAFRIAELYHDAQPAPARQRCESVRPWGAQCFHDSGHGGPHEDNYGEQWD